MTSTPLYPEPTPKELAQAAELTDRLRPPKPLPSTSTHVTAVAYPTLTLPAPNKKRWRQWWQL